MKKIACLFVICSVMPLAALSAAGKKDSSEENYLNKEWALCITAFDYSGLSGLRRIAGDVINRDLVTQLQSVNYRLRLSPEYAYYESFAHQQALSVAAKALSNKLDERSQLVYRGEPNWKYRSSLKKIDADIVKLREEYNLKEADRPLIDSEPVFVLSRANIGGTFPAPPEPGAERRFCREQNADAFLEGEVREFHGRYYVRLRLFTLFTNSWAYEDDVIFSVEDIDGAVTEIAARLTAVLSGNRPASVAVIVDPDDAQVLINQNFAGRGTVPARERPPGVVTVAVGAEGFSPVFVETVLEAGEHTDISVTLSPLNYSEVLVDAPVHESAHVYHGALYVGEAPYILPLPINQLNYFVVETPGGQTGKAVITSPNMPEERFDLSMKTKTPPRPGEKRVNKARARHYWAWGATWVAGIAAWTSYGIFQSQNQALAYSNEASFFESTQTVAYVFNGALIATGVIAAFEVFQMLRYLYTATENVTPIVKQRHKK